MSRKHPNRRDGNRLQAGSNPRVRRRRLELEPLEPRSLLAADVGPPSLSAAFLVDPPAEFRLERVSSSISRLSHQFTAHVSASRGAEFLSNDPAVEIVNGRVIVDAVTAGSTNDLAAALEGLGAQVTGKFGGMVSAWVPLGKLKDLPALSGLAYAKTSSTLITHVGVTTTQGDPAMNTDDVRAVLGLDGTGQKIGVLSDSYNFLGGAGSDVSNGDLPGVGNPSGNTTPVQVLADSSVSTNIDEGRAMLQLVHDVAPKAQLAFATAQGGQAAFASQINALRTAGATVIVDDALYPDEPMFMDGLVAQAADAAIAAGVPYVSAAGNAARVSYQAANFVNSFFVSPNYGRGFLPLHDFDSGAGLDPYQLVTLPAQSTTTFVFQWQDPFKSVAPGSTGATRDFDILIFNNSPAPGLLGVSAAANFGGDPVEIITVTNSGGVAASINVGLAGAITGGTSMLKYVAITRSASGALATINQFATNSPTSYGHANAANVLAVGAANARLTPEFGTSPPQLEPFSSAGGVPILFNTSGAPISPVVRQTPDVVGPDNGNTTFFGVDDTNATYDPDTFPNFKGTSAAAPHVAGLVALMRQARPGAFPTTLFSTLQSTAVNMGLAGFDNDSGWGFVHGLNAAFASFTPSMPDLAAASDNGKFDNDNVTSLGGVTITGVAPANSFVALTMNGVNIATQQLTGGATNYTFTPGLSMNALFPLSIRVKPSSTSPDSAYSLNSSVLSIFTDSLATSVPTVPDLIASSDSGLSTTDDITTDTTPTFNGTGVSGANMVLMIDGVPTVSSVLTGTTYSYTPPPMSPGYHTVTMRMHANLQGPPLSSYFDSPPVNVFIDNGAAPVATISAVSSPRNSVPGAIQITWDRTVTGFDISDLSLIKNGGPNRLPSGTPSLTTSDSRVFTLSHIDDITQVIGNYVLTLNYAGSGIQSLASGAAPSGSNPSSAWTQFNVTYQNPAGYFDVNNDTFVSPIDALLIINILNAGNGGALPGTHGPPPPYIDPSGDNFVSPIDALLVINYLNASYGSGPILMAVQPGGGVEDSFNPAEAEVEVRLELVDLAGNPIDSIPAGESFALRGYADVTNSAAAGVFAAYADALFDPALVKPSGTRHVSGSGRLSLLDEVGSILGMEPEQTASRAFFEQQFVAVRSGVAVFQSEAADEKGNDILVFGANEGLPSAQITFGDARLTILAKKKTGAAALLTVSDRADPPQAATSDIRVLHTMSTRSVVAPPVDVAATDTDYLENVDLVFESFGQSEEILDWEEILG